jgi:hypothetical protein
VKREERRKGRGRRRLSDTLHGGGGEAQGPPGVRWWKVG